MPIIKSFRILQIYISFFKKNINHFHNLFNYNIFQIQIPLYNNDQKNKQIKYIYSQIFSMFAAYNKLLAAYPIPTKMVTSGTLFSLGDYITQAVVDGKQKIDWIRNRNLFIVGATYLAPMLHMWYCKVLPRLGNLIFKQTTPKAVRVFSSMACDQLLFAPIFLSGFFIFDGIVKNFSLQGVKNGIKSYRQKIWQTMKINWMIWPIASTINFALVPVQYQVLFANFVGLFWNVILSYIANDQKSPSQKAAQNVV